jgi:lipid A 3-O-deacylase
MPQKTICLIVALFAYFGIVAQKNNVHQLSITTDNDAYLGKLKDGYYSSGFFIHYRFASTNKQPNVLKELSLTHKIFTPQGRLFYIRNGIDRPFCGLSSLSYAQTHFVSKKWLYQWEGNLSTIGPNALGENIQFVIHRIMGFRQYGGWENQLQNEIGINARAMVAYNALIKQESSWYKVLPFAEASVGNTFTYAKVGGFFCLGWMNETNQSALLNTHLLSMQKQHKKKFELFFSFQPQITAYAYNATVQGCISATTLYR